MAGVDNSSGETALKVLGIIKISAADRLRILVSISRALVEEKHFSQKKQN